MKKWDKPDLAELKIKSTMAGGVPTDDPDYGLYDVNGNLIPGKTTYGPSGSSPAHAEVQ